MSSDRLLGAFGQVVVGINAARARESESLFAFWRTVRANQVEALAVERGVGVRPVRPAR